MSDLKKLFEFNLKYKQNGGSSNENDSFFKQILVIMSDTYKNIKEVFIVWIIVPILFGCFMPAIPFFIVLAFLYGILKYFYRLNLQYIFLMRHFDHYH